jgi:hypothetical protein
MQSGEPVNQPRFKPHGANVHEKEVNRYTNASISRFDKTSLSEHTLETEEHCNSQTQS